MQVYGVTRLPQCDSTMLYVYYSGMGIPGAGFAKFHLQKPRQQNGQARFTSHLLMKTFPPEVETVYVSEITTRGIRLY